MNLRIFWNLRSLRGFGVGTGALPLWDFDGIVFDGMDFDGWILMGGF
jgi:hypothetical protein